MESIALGVLGWKPEDLEKYSLETLLCAYDGWRKGMQEKWEIARYSSFWQVIATQGNKHFKSPESLGKFPWEFEEADIERMTPTKSHRFTREEVKAIWKSKGYDIDEWHLDKMRFKE